MLSLEGNPSPNTGPGQINQNAVGFSRVIVIGLVLALLTAAGGIWWMCDRSQSIAFLPSRAGAAWIVFPGTAEATRHDTVSVTVAFRHAFKLTSVPADATLTVCGFKGVAVAINGREVGQALCTGRNWKSPSSAGVAGWLQPGTNEITAWVTNAAGPPALWLRLGGDRFSLGTSGRWQASLNGSEWRSARLARQPLDFKLDDSLYGMTGITNSLKKVWPLEAAFIAVSLALVWVARRWLRHKHQAGNTPPAAASTKLIYGLLVVVLVARAALFINNVHQLPRSMGFDAAGHEEYIRFIQQKHALPLADDGWEMFQPPLYYLASTLVLDGFGRSVGDDDTVFFLRAVNGLIGLLHCWVVLLCLRLLFRDNIQAQAAGLLVAAFLPPHLYLSQYVTNEPLAGFLVTVAIYYCLRVLRSEKEGFWMPVGIGLALGAAMLAKFSVVLALPFFPAALILQSVAQKQFTRREWLRSVGLVVAGFVIVCGWHYARVWARFGTPIIGNWDTRAGQIWWQDPGFRTSAFYCSFGRVLVSPPFSGFHGFADGFYSTLWGDGLGSGMADPACQPPWNYELMGVGYWVSLGMSMLLVIGTALTFARLTSQFIAKCFLILGMACLFGLGILWMSLSVPSYAQVKAFYAFPALLPFSALVVAGWDWLRRRHRAAGTAAWVLLLVWSMTAYTSFWVRRGNPATRFVQSIFLGIDLADKGQTDGAIRQFQEAIRLKPDYVDAYIRLGAALADKGRLDDAIREFQEGIRFKPDDALARYNLGVALDKQGRIDEAILQYQEATRLKPDYVDACNNLGIAFGRKGRFDEAIGEFQKVIRLKPDYAAARDNLAMALELQRQSNVRTR